MWYCTSNVACIHQLSTFLFCSGKPHPDAIGRNKAIDCLLLHDKQDLKVGPFLIQGNGIRMGNIVIETKTG